MFGLGITEILLILAIALIIIGPKKLPEFGKTLGRALNEFKKGAQDFKRNLDIDTTLNDIKDVKDIAPTKSNLKKALKDAVFKADADSESKNGADQDSFQNTEEAEKNHEKSWSRQPSDIYRTEGENTDKSENSKRVDQ
jgi:TatA/E family protein of Tat protein translocase